MGIVKKALIFNNEISLSLVDVTDLVNTAIEYHHMSRVCAAAFGRTAAITSFMATSLKNDSDSLTVTVDGDGVGGKIVVCANSHLDVRGLVDNPQMELPIRADGKLDVGGFVGKGKLNIVKSLGMKQPYTGSCNLVSGEIGEDFAAYYTYSEQQPTAISVGVLMGTDGNCMSAGALILQALPDASEDSLDKAEELLSQFPSFSAVLNEKGVDGICKEFFNDVEFENRETAYRCTCSKDYIDKVLITLGKNELDDLIAKDGKIEVACHFCPKKYLYYKEDIDKLFE